MKNLNIDKSAWKLVKFGDVVAEPKESVSDIASSGLEHLVGLEHIDSESIHLCRSANLQDEETTFTKVFRSGDVLFGRRRAYLKKAAQANFDGVCSGDITVFRAKKNLLPVLLPFVVNNDKFFDYAVKHSAGGLSPRVKFKDLANYEFLLPPKEQQAELAELLWAMDEVIEKDLAVLEMLGIAFKVNANQSLNIGYADDFISLPKGWKVNKLKEIAKVNSGSTPLRANKDFFENGTVPWVKTLDLNNGVISSTEESITELALSKTSCKKRSVGTVLVAMYGGFNQIGRTGILEIEAATNQAISAIDLNRELIRPKYLLYVLNSRIDYWKKVAVSSRKDPNITKADVENFPVVYPSLDTQDAIIAEIDLMKVSNAKIESKIAASKALQKSLINEIF